MVFEFDAKSGKRQRYELEDAELLPVVKSLRRRRGGGEELLAYRDGPRWIDLRSSDVNDYLRDASGAEHTAKDFRTWHATVLAAVSLSLKDREATSVTSRRRLVSSSVKEVAASLGNTPAVARASYIDPRLLDRYEEGVTMPARSAPRRQPRVRVP
jgi:DNA topoisomerase IB